MFNRNKYQIKPQNSTRHLMSLSSPEGSQVRLENAAENN